MKKIFYLTATLAFLLTPLMFLKADGGFIPYNYEDLYEPSQTALIVYDNGREDLYLKASYEGETNRFVWIIPAPSLPTVEEAPERLFEELSEYTKTETIKYLDSGYGYADNIGMSAGLGVTVHSRQNIGIYDVSVLSATGSDGLLVWLNENGYQVSPEVKEFLDWYIEKEWYFTAVRIEPENLLALILEAAQEIDPAINMENLSEKLADYIYSSFKNQDYDLFLKTFAILILIDPLYSFMELTYEEFIETQDFFEEYGEEEMQEEIMDFAEAIDYMLKEINPAEIDRFSSYLKPIKISFAASEIIYPLKISQISTRVPDKIDESPKTNEILIYVATDKYVEAPEFKTEFNGLISPALINTKESQSYLKLEGLKEIITQEYHLSKIRRSFAKEEMDEDLYFTVNRQPKIDSDGLANDVRRIADLKHLEIALLNYKYEHDVYPEDIYQNEELKNYLNTIPVNPGIGGIKYGYQSLANGLDYEINFRLEAGYSDYYDRYGAGPCKLTPVSGIKCENEGEKNQVNVYYFYSENCSYCDSADRFLDSLTIKYDNIKIKKIDVWNNERNREMFKKAGDYLKERYDVNFSGVPIVVVGKKYVVGYGSDETSGQEIEKHITDCFYNNCRDYVADFLLVPLSESYNKQLGKTPTVTVKTNGQTDINLFSPKDLASDFSQRLIGRIILEVEKNGEAWYMSPKSNKAYFLGRPKEAFAVMRSEGIGITNADLAKIPIGLGSLSGPDSDGDGLPDLLEDAIGTDKYKADTDGDGYSDFDELKHGFDPLKGGGAKLNYDLKFAQAQKGKIFLQVEGSGEAWYINPVDNMRYFLGRPDDAFQIMRNLGLGISSSDFAKL